MLDQNERTWRSQSPASGDTTTRVVEHAEDVGTQARAAGSAAALGAAADTHACPVCEFVGAEYNDVYGHLMTAHRKSKLSSMLLETE